jgi:lysophospholipase L1-like esterase
MANQTQQVFIDNRARPGLTIGSILRTADTDFATHRSIGGVAAVLSVGLNESKIMPGLTKPVVMPGLFATQLERYSTMAAAREVPTVFVGPQPAIVDTLVSEYTGATIERDITEEYAEAMRAEAKATGMPYIDTFELFGDPPEGYYMAPDGVHPTALGHMALHQAISGALSDIRFL